MSDSVTKWHEMQKDKKYIFESPDGGKTVTRRLFGSDVEKREVIQAPISEDFKLKKQAYSLLTEYDEKVVLLAAKILDIGE